MFASVYINKNHWVGGSMPILPMSQNLHDHVINLKIMYHVRPYMYMERKDNVFVYVFIKRIETYPQTN